MTAAGKVAALGVLDREWRELDALFRGLTPAELERPMYTEDGPGWRVRDLPKPDERVRTFIGLTDTVDDMNEVTFRAWRERAVADLLAEFREKHDELMRGLAGLAPEQIMNGDTVDDLFMAFRVPGVVHLQKHRGELATALAKEGAAS